MRRDGVLLPRVRYWTAWNEPNLQIGLVPQWVRSGGRWVIQSARDYARICNAVVDGIRTAMVPGSKVACGVTAARGNNNPRGDRPSVSPLAFLRALKAAGARGFDAYAHHPYYGAPSESPTSRSPGRGGVNFEEIIRALNQIGYEGPLSVEWEDSGMDREHGAREACEFLRKLDFEPSRRAFDAAFAES